MLREFFKKIREAIFSTLPIVVIVLFLHISRLVSIGNSKDIIKFLICSLFLIIGMGLFTLGSDIAMTPMGEHVGEEVIKSKKLWLAIIIVLILGTLISIAEPDLSVLANQVPINTFQFIIIVSVGVGIFLVISLLRIIFKIDLRLLLFIFYGILFLLVIFMKKLYLPLSFDAGGVTTGPVTVPFLLALGVGIASVSGGKNNREDSFGMIALCSIGPILLVVIMSFFFKDAPTWDGLNLISKGSIFKDLCYGLLHSLKDVFVALAPILVFFYIFQACTVKLPKKRLLKIFIGILYTYFGLVLFLTAVNVGFMPIGVNIGGQLANKAKYFLIPLGFVIGVFVVLAEPAVHTLNKQVEEVSGGTITKKSVFIGLAIGVGLSLALSMVRIIFDFSLLWLLVPGYFIALLLSFFVPKVYTAIAFDSGGVASGPMTAGFILPFAIGTCLIINPTNIFAGAFGIVAMVAMTPLITIQLLGFYVVMKEKVRAKLHKRKVKAANENQIIYFE